jgi:hypothetical protein
MTVRELEQRVEALEKEVRRLNASLEARRNGDGKGWLAAVERFAGDADLLSIFEEAKKLRAKSRERAQRESTARRKRRP